jgi:hypothetical protein
MDGGIFRWSVDYSSKDLGRHRSQHETPELTESKV